MKQFALIGLGRFATRILEELSTSDCQIMVIDKDREAIELFKDKVSFSYIANVYNEEALKKLIPKEIDAVIIDLGDKTEVSILVTHYLKKMKVKSIIAKAESNEHGELLEIAGATEVIYPNKEAAMRVAPLLVSSLISSYFPLSKEFVIAEIIPPAKYVGKSLIELNLRSRHQINVIAVRKVDSEEYDFFTPEYKITENDVFLIAGRQKDVSSFADISIPGKKNSWLSSMFHKVFFRKK